jgi:hypothetical protein
MTVPLSNAGLMASFREKVAAIPAGDARTGYEQALDASATLSQLMTDRAVAAVEDHEALGQAR